eukprot:CAMPEP_0172552266 /NCGR_PEP_ID=MMETSP1067-20121228/43720_1 /TAXON_ID=265564 ORGANISM="Thalassiosira punctigera, Strain Tpunct2005C2" /NCGR_SAMPLE_ID=MMETSP1067 /ASSEMBLY_ACC=CAM_ASM_000444 /LENGTH=431 /DNA_ID=CAMNT_0013340199 /DNA_START=92 /DNA_END=1383 /DNA_ORIENTATION=+
MEPQYKYIGFVGCYTKEGQADPFEASHGGAPHDRSKIGAGVLAIGVSASGNLSFLNSGEPIIKADELPNPSYLCILERSKNSSRPAALRDGGLCIVSEVEKGAFQSFSLCCNQTQSGLDITGSAIGEALETGGSYPCHIISSDVGGDMECIAVCNYGEDEGVLSMFGKGSDSYSRKVCIRFGPGSKADPDRQQTSHAHAASVVTPTFPYSLMDLCCADLGSDAIVQFSMGTDVSSADGEFSFQCVEKGRLAAPPGSGPRSLMMNPVFKNVAVISLELTAQVWLICRLKDGSFKGLGDPVSVLPENWPGESLEEDKFNHGRWASDAVWSPDGKFVYAAARLHNSISVFQFGTYSESVESEGLKLVQRVPTEGLTPRCLCMSECGKFMLVAHQHSHDITSFQRNESNGTIKIKDRLEAPNAACVKLVCPDQIG